MAKRAWKVELRARPRSDGLERLGQAVKLVIDREVLDRGSKVTTHNTNEASKLGMHASIGAALEELDA
jgi:hypothetical protein